jgi:multidrug efflux pump subunit AcrB
VNREKAAGANIQAGEVGAALAPATSSSRFTLPNYWRDPASGVSYQVQVEIPQALMKAPSDVGTIPVRANGGTPTLVRDVADVKESTMPGQIDRYNQRRVVSLTGNIQGTDLGDVAVRVSKAMEAAGPAPQGVNVDVRGQVTPMRELFDNLENGLLASVAVILLLLTAYFQSIRLALIAVAGVPAVLCGVAAALLGTGTTLNLQSFMGAIMAVGVAVANAILFVTFAERARLAGESATEAALSGVRARVRPILMTSAAMVAGMVPMAVFGDQSAPLARAVIGGLLTSTAATLILLPAVFALLMGGAGRESRSLDPFDPSSLHHVSGEATA